MEVAKKLARIRNESLIEIVNFAIVSSKLNNISDYKHIHNSQFICKREIAVAHDDDSQSRANFHSEEVQLTTRTTS
jgi:hypothetical protein